MNDSFDQLLNGTDLTAQDNGTTLKRLRRATDEEALRTRVGPMFYQWIESLKSDPWGLEFDDEQLKKLVEGTVKFMETRGLSLLSRKAYDAARRHFSRVGLLPEGLWTEDELLAERIEQSDTTSFAVRQEFVRESRRIREGQ